MSKDWDNLLLELDLTKEDEDSWMKYIDSDEFLELTGGISTEDNENFYLAKSALHGKGLFAKRDLKANELIGYVSLNNKRTLIARYTNHSDSNNATINNNTLYTEVDIKKDKEILINYRNQPELIQIIKLFK
jgi:hypothetical protein